MGEIKSVKVDNWGVFFLQKLQNFFNKTDYCDLTLQFRDNSQLKVHRLVLSACTDYFNVLEQTCEVVDDALIMPNELQADVVVPIVNFMYTGTLEFELKMYGKLLRTAKEMNMTVLLKLLEAHRRTMENVNRAQRPPSPKAIRRRPTVGVQSTGQFQNQSQQTRRVITTDSLGSNILQRRVVQNKATGTNVSPSLQAYRQQIGSTSVVRTSAMRSNQPNIQSYIKNEPGEYETITTTQPTSPFEQLRKGYNNNKRPAVTTFSSPPAKKPNLEDVKEFAEQQRMRKQIAAEYGEDQEFESMMDDDIHNDDDDDDAGVGAPTHSSSVVSNATPSETVRNTSITFKQESDGQPPTIIVKDSSGSKLNHAKIISEVLRQYPHLAKGNKNIKLKIMPNASGQAQRIIVKKEAETSSQQTMQNTSKQNLQQKSALATQSLSSQITVKTGDRILSQGQQAVADKFAGAATQKPAVSTPGTTADTSQQKRRIDSKTMHALIALGAENTTGPWLCLRCGVNGRPISIPSYRGFRRHLINTHKETIDPSLCEHCGWRSRTNRELHFHMQIDHKIKTTLYTFPECLLCAELFLDTNALNQHMLDSHPSANKQQCIYCNKIFVKEMQLYTHMKLYHKHMALEDGIIDASDEEFSGLHGEEGDDLEQMETDSDREGSQSASERKEAKVKILSDISLPMASSVIKLDNENIKETTDVTIDAQTKFVTADGNEMILTEEQRKEIMAQLNQDHNNGGVVMVLHEAIFPPSEAIGEEAANSAEEPSTREDIASEEELDDSQIFAELASSQSEKTEKPNNPAPGKETMDNLEWAENLISEHELADSQNNVTNKKDEEDKMKKDNISEKLRELTGDWSEDENDEGDVNESSEKSEKTDADKTDLVGNKLEEELKPDQTEEFETVSEKQIADNGHEKPYISEKDQDREELNKDIVSEPINETENIKIEEDDLDLAMQNLHEGEIKEENKSSGDLQPTNDESKTKPDEVKSEAESVETPIRNNDEQTAAIIASDIKNTNEVDPNAALLDELMSTTVDSGANKVKLLDDSDDVEEFIALDKNEQQLPIEAPAEEAKITSEANEETIKSLEESKSAEKDTKSSNTDVAVSSVAKSLSSDWEDIEDDDDDDDVTDDITGEEVD